jgi:cation diffusion facilitator family transporter
MSTRDQSFDPALKAMRLSVVSVVANVLLALIKGIAGVLGQSYALVADAAESILDIFSSLVVWGGLRFAAKPPDENHPYGHGKAEPLASIVVSLALLGAAVGIALASVESLKRAQEPPAMFTLYVIVGVLVIKETLFRMLRAAGRRYGSTALQSDAWHHRSDAITSLAALVGIAIAVFGGPEYASADDWAALLACGIIAFNGLRLLRPAFREIMDEAPDPSVAEEVRKCAERVQGVVGLDVCLVRKMGLHFFVDLHVCVPGALTVREGHRIAHDVRDAVVAEVQGVVDVLVHIEPVEEEMPELVKKG